jgi:ribosomal-protein-serine acetyltransferase
MATAQMPLSLPEAPQLRPFEEADADELHGLIEADRARLAEWLPWAAEQDREGTVEFIRRSRQEIEEGIGYQAAIAPEGAIVGVIGCRPINWSHGSTNIGYWLAEAGVGKGTMTAAVRALTDHAFGSWGLHRVEIMAATQNRRSRAVPERLGFAEEGTLRGAEQVGDRHLDIVVYGMLAADWRG